MTPIIYSFHMYCDVYEYVHENVHAYVESFCLLKYNLANEKQSTFKPVIFKPFLFRLKMYKSIFNFHEKILSYTL